uniref:hypothetical protein n=1 Tax=Endozoicomonas sp. ONNA2 TaxID=2828741 RepID=UPI002147A2F2
AGVRATQEQLPRRAVYSRIASQTVRLVLSTNTNNLRGSKDEVLKNVEAMEEMVVHQSSLSEAGFKLPHAAVIKSGGRER